MLKILNQKIKGAQKPVAIFDLDGTIFDVNHRHLSIIQKFIAQNEIRAMFPDQCKAMDGLKAEHFLYAIEATLNSIGLDRYSEHSAKFIQMTENFWFKHFFTDEYVLHDQPFEGALKCVKHMHDQGVHIAYLSGRDVPNMSKGTIGALEKYGFPHTGHNVSMCLKPAYGLDDLLFKKQSLTAIESNGQVIATFDNEPANVQMFIEAYPQALNFHFDSQYARMLDLKGESFHRIKSFVEIGF